MSAAARALGADVTSNTNDNPPFTDKYTVERVLGRGGMGTVFEARHTRLGQRVAIKVLGNELRVYPELVKRFEREARAAGSLSSPHAVRVFDIDQTDDGTPFIVMELLSGRDLAHVIEEDGAQPVGLACRWIIEASDAIAEAHHLGIIHRDIKPSNLLLCDSGSIKVLDFGIAKRVPTRGNGAEREAAITLGVAPLGTPQYMSPEQVRCAKDVDARSDIWSLAVTLYELLTGRPPFNHDVAQACIAAIVADPIPDPRVFRPDIPEGLALALLHALEKNPDERCPSVDAFVEAITPFADPAPAAQRHGSAPELRAWRSISGVGSRRVATHDATLDGDDLVLELQAPSAPRPRAHVPSIDDTVPPAVSRALVATARGKRIRSSLAVAFAAGLGLLALVSTPRCAMTRLDTAAASQTRSGIDAPVAAPPIAPKAIAVASAAGEADPPPPAEKTAVAAPSAVTAPPAQAKPSPVKRSTSNANVRVIGADRPVHGGISNPGF